MQFMLCCHNDIGQPCVEMICLYLYLFARKYSVWQVVVHNRPYVILRKGRLGDLGKLTKPLISGASLLRSSRLLASWKCQKFVYEAYFCIIMTFLPSPLKANAHYSLESLSFGTWSMLGGFVMVLLSSVIMVAGHTNRSVCQYC